MPIIKSAKKKMRKDKKLTAHNAVIKANIKALIKNLRKNPTQKGLENVSSALDKAVKTKYIHANKSSRLKSRLAKLVAQPSSASGSNSVRLKSTKKAVKKAPIKKSSKK